MKKNHFLVFGEDDNDRRALVSIVKSLAPNARVETRHKPMVLSREAEKSGKRRTMAQDISAFVKHSTNKETLATAVLHHDCDAVEPAHVEEANAMRERLRAAGVESIACAHPAWEIETWWMLFPASVQNARGCWRQIDYSRVNVGSITNAKERLKRDLRPAGAAAQKKCKDYSETDSIKIAEHIRATGALTKATRGRCASLEAFCSEIEAAVGQAEQA